MQSTPDEVLIGRIANSDRLAMQVLFARYHVRAFRFVVRLVGDETTAEDVISEVFLDVWRQAGRFEGRSTVATWLLAIARSNDLKDRLAKFALSLHPEKTRLIEFGRYAAERRADRGKGKPETFDFLGFTHYCGTKKDSADFQLGRKTQRKRMKAKLREIKETLRQNRHKPIDEQGRWLATVIKGYFAYFAVPTNTYLLSAFRYHISMKWFQSLRRRSQRHRAQTITVAASVCLRSN